MSRTLRQSLYELNFDTRSRNFAVARVLRPLLGESKRRAELLDAGCGRAGIAAYVGGRKVVGLDMQPPDLPYSNLQFVRGSIAALPFGDESFPIVSSIDVLEHLPLDVRERGVSELVRVASRAVVVACPQGDVAARSDAAFQSALERRGRAVPEWLIEHGRQEYPEVQSLTEQIRAAADATGRSVRITVSYGEPLKLSRILRGAAVVSDWLFIATNFVFGLLFSTRVPKSAGEGYRMIVLAELSRPSV